jgi:hypothetical protein
MSIWGVASPLPLDQVIAPTGDVTLTAGTEVLIATTTALISPAGLNVYPFVFCSLTFLMGATASTALVIAFRFNGGADISTYTVAPALLANNATIQIPCFFVGANSSSAFAGAGKIIEITGKATTTACTAKQVGSTAIVGLSQGPDA